MALSLTLALGIIAGAWAIGGRQGFEAIGSGGANLQLLPKIGEPTPAFTAVALTGETVDSRAFAGRPLLDKRLGLVVRPVPGGAPRHE